MATLNDLSSDERSLLDAKFKNTVQKYQSLNSLPSIPGSPSVPSQQSVSFTRPSNIPISKSYDPLDSELSQYKMPPHNTHNVTKEEAIRMGTKYGVPYAGILASLALPEVAVPAELGALGKIISPLIKGAAVGGAMGGASLAKSGIEKISKLPEAPKTLSEATEKAKNSALLGAGSEVAIPALGWLGKGTAKVVSNLTTGASGEVTERALQKGIGTLEETGSKKSLENMAYKIKAGMRYLKKSAQDAYDKVLNHSSAANQFRIGSKEILSDIADTEESLKSVISKGQEISVGNKSIITEPNEFVDPSVNMGVFNKFKNKIIEAFGNKRTLSAKDIHSIRQQLDVAIDKSDGYFTKQLEELRNSLNDRLQTAYPELRQADKTYTDMFKVRQDVKDVTGIGTETPINAKSEIVLGTKSRSIMSREGRVAKETLEDVSKLPNIPRGFKRAVEKMKDLGSGEYFFLTQKGSPYRNLFIRLAQGTIEAAKLGRKSGKVLKQIPKLFGNTNNEEE